MSIDNSHDVIDSRDVIARIDEIQADFDRIEINEANGGRPTLDDNGQPIVALATCGTCGRTWNDALITDRTPVPAARCPYEALHDDLAELDALIRLQDAADGSPDWEHGESLIRDSYFTDYARELAIDCAGSRDESRILAGEDTGKGWPWSHMTIDWEAAADALKADYFDVDFAGVTYWIRG